MRHSNLEIGQKHGNLLLLENLETKDKHGAKLWLCECVCGNKKITSSGKVRRGDSCGCIALKNNIERGLPIGKRFGKLVVIKRLNEIDKFRSRKYLFQCDCGNEKILSSHNLTAGTKSCGCLGHIKLACGEAAFNQLYLNYKYGAKRRDLKFSLSKDEFLNFTKLECYYCGSSPSQIYGNRNNGKYIYNGVDRLDSSQEYCMTNCVACCGKCNKMKMDATVKDFLDHVTKIHQKQTGG